MTYNEKTNSISRTLLKPHFKRGPFSSVPALTSFFVHIQMSLEEEFEDTKGVIIIHKSKKNRQHNEQKKKYKRTNNNLQNTAHKTKY